MNVRAARLTRRAPRVRNILLAAMAASSGWAPAVQGMRIAIQVKRLGVCVCQPPAVQGMRIPGSGRVAAPRIAPAATAPVEACNTWYHNTFLRTRLAPGVGHLGGSCRGAAGDEA